LNYRIAAYDNETRLYHDNFNSCFFQYLAVMGTDPAVGNQYI